MVEHFGYKTKNPNLKINRDNYAIINKKVTDEKKILNNKFLREMYNKYCVIEDGKLLYTDEFCEKHRKDCLENYDLNMNFFKNLSSDKFEKELNKLLKTSKKITEIHDLAMCKDMCGIYIMVLDEYKQVYIGQSKKSIKTRITRHWSKTKEFDKLIDWNKEESVLSIDSFGPLDTTRIYVYPVDYWLVDKTERKLTDIMNDDYQLNRTNGGITDSGIYLTVELFAGRKKRDLKKYMN